MTHYIDPNSGAAPQPGGWAGEEAQATGHAVADQEGVEQTRPLNEPLAAPSEPKTVSELAEIAQARQDEKSQLTDRQQARKEEIVEAAARPREALADLDEGDSASSLEGPDYTEAERADAQSLEHQGINPGLAEVDEEDDEAVEQVDSDYDPSEHNVTAVQQYLAEHPEERDAVTAKERDGDNRKGIVG